MPAKILLPFDGEQTILDIMLKKIKRDNPGLRVIVATTVNSSDDVIERKAMAHGVDCFRGSEDDVLSRFMGAADRFGVGRIIRVCSDNPFMQTASFAELFRASDACFGADYVAFAFPDGRPTIKSHLGLYAELVKTDALRRVMKATEPAEGPGDKSMPEAERKLYREHVTIYLYTHPESFKLRYLPLPKELQDRTDIRLTLDTPSDFSLLQELYKKLEASSSLNSLPALLDLVDSNPEYGKIMKININQNSK